MYTATPPPLSVLASIHVHDVQWSQNHVHSTHNTCAVFSSAPMLQWEGPQLHVSVGWQEVALKCLWVTLSAFQSLIQSDYSQTNWELPPISVLGWTAVLPGCLVITFFFIQRHAFVAMSLLHIIYCDSSVDYNTCLSGYTFTCAARLLNDLYFLAYYIVQMYTPVSLPTVSVLYPCCGGSWWLSERC